MVHSRLFSGWNVNKRPEELSRGDPDANGIFHQRSSQSDCQTARWSAECPNGTTFHRLPSWVVLAGTISTAGTEFESMDLVQSFSFDVERSSNGRNCGSKYFNHAEYDQRSVHYENRSKENVNSVGQCEARWSKRERGRNRFRYAQRFSARSHRYEERTILRNRIDLGVSRRRRNTNADRTIKSKIAERWAMARSRWISRRLERIPKGQRHLSSFA